MYPERTEVRLWLLQNLGRRVRLVPTASHPFGKDHVAESQTVVCSGSWSDSKPWEDEY